jgi:hypothetical protein
MTLPVTLCIHPILPSKRISSSIAPMIDSVWKFLPRWGMLSLTLELEKVLFHSEHSIELDQEGVRKRNTSRVMKHNPILQGAMSPTQGRKSSMRDREVFLLPTVPISPILRDQCILHRFLCFPPPFVNLGMRFLLRREGCNIPCYDFPNYLHYTLKYASNPLINPFLSKPKSKFKSNS